MATLERNRIPLPPAVRRLPIGCELQPRGGAHFRVWAPKCVRVAAQIARRNASAESDTLPLVSEEPGYFSGFDPQAQAGDLYWFSVDDDVRRYPDPASRFQPEGPHGPSQIIDPTTYEWNDEAWPGVNLAGQVLYELHLGTFTQEGTWTAAARELAELRSIGITVVEIMPVACFPGRFNWGYDGVGLYAPYAGYGTPDDMRRFIDTAHQLGIGVILDVVYNHLGPDGNYLSRFSDDYLSRERNEWGQNINFDGPNSGPVREYFIHNAGYWIDEFHLDGLRLDATQDIHDRSESHVLCDLTEHARRRAAPRSIIVVGENEPQDTRLIRDCDEGGYGLDGIWNDDFHHSALVALTGRREAYYHDYQGRAQEFVSAFKYGYLYQGQWYGWQQKPRGTSSRGIPPWAFLTYLENHDQVANSLRGDRLCRRASPARWRAMTALLLLGPSTPLLFQGQEFGSSRPFLFFADHESELAAKVDAGRREFLEQFPSLAAGETLNLMAPPADPQTFERCKLDLSERQQNAGIYQMHKDLLRLRRTEPALMPRDVRWFDGAALADDALVIRYFGESDEDDRLLVVCLGADRPLAPIPEPLVAPPPGRQWAIGWSSEDPQYGGSGTPSLATDAAWQLLGESAMWLRPEVIER